MAFARRQWNLLLQRIRYAHLSDSVFRHLQRMRKCKEKHKDVYTCDTRKHRSIKFWRDRTTTFWCEIWLCNMAYLCLRRLVGTYDATTQAQAHESGNRSILLCLYLRLRRCVVGANWDDASISTGTSTRSKALMLASCWFTRRFILVMLASHV